MAQVRNPLLSSDARGTINKSLTFTHQSGHNVVQGYKKARKKNDEEENEQAKKLSVASKLVKKGWKKYSERLFVNDRRKIDTYMQEIERVLTEFTPPQKKRGGSFMSGNMTDTNIMISVLVKSRLLVERVSHYVLANRSDTVLYINPIYEDGCQYEESMQVGISGTVTLSGDEIGIVISREAVDLGSSGIVDWLTRPIDFSSHSNILFLDEFKEEADSKKEFFLNMPDSIDINQNSTKVLNVEIDARAYDGTEMMKLFVENTDQLSRKGVVFIPWDDFYVGAQKHNASRPIKVGRKTETHTAIIVVQSLEKRKKKNLFINVRNKSDVIAAQSLFTFDFEQGVTKRSGNIITSVLTRGTLISSLQAPQPSIQPFLIDIDSNFGGGASAVNSGLLGEAHMYATTGIVGQGDYTIVLAINCKLRRPFETGIVSFGIDRIRISSSGEIIAASGITQKSCDVRINRTTRNIVQSDKTEIVAAATQANSMNFVTLMNATTLISSAYNETKFGAGFVFAGNLIATDAPLLRAAEEYLNETYALDVL